MQCCVCQKRGDHTHHLDGDPGNTVLDNLAVLCYPHHVEAEEKSKLRKNLTKGVIKRYRAAHYRSIQAARDRAAGVDDKVKVLTAANLVQASITASALVELERLHSEYERADPWDREALLGRFWAYSRYNNPQIAYTVMEFVHSRAGHIRGQMSEVECNGLFSMASSFFPYGTALGKKRLDDLAVLYVDAGYLIAYYAAKERQKLHLALIGLAFLKFIYMMGKRYNTEGPVKRVRVAFAELRAHMEVARQTDLGIFKEMYAFFETQLDDGHISYPVFPVKIMHALDAEGRS